jgi:hypothetical protein
VIVTIARAGTHLVADAARSDRTDIFPVSATEFTTKDGGTTYRFVAAPNGQIARYLRSVNGGSWIPARRIR